MISVIPARKGSKGVINKNFRMIPKINICLVDLTILQALLSKKFQKVIVTCDYDFIPNEKIRKYLDSSVNVVRRPPELAQDSSPVEDAILHLIQEDHIRPTDRMCLLQPTSPMRTPNIISQAISYFEMEGSPVTGITEVGDKHPARMYEKSESGLSRIYGNAATRRQDLSKIYYKYFHVKNFSQYFSNVAAL